MTPAAWAWVALAGMIISLVVGFDLWAHFTNHISMSGQFHNWLHGEITGPLILGLVTGVLAGLTLHFITTTGH